MGGYAAPPLEFYPAFLREQGLKAGIDLGVIVLARSTGAFATGTGSGFGWVAEPLREPEQFIPKYIDRSILGGFAAIHEHPLAIRARRTRDNVKRDGGSVFGKVEFADPAVIDGKGIGITEPFIPFVRFDCDFPIRLEAVRKTHRVQAAQSEIVEEVGLAAAEWPHEFKNLRQVEPVFEANIFRRYLRCVAIIHDR